MLLYTLDSIEARHGDDALQEKSFALEVELWRTYAVDLSGMHRDGILYIAVHPRAAKVIGESDQT